MTLITVNTATDTFNDCDFDSTASATTAIRWLADKYGTAANNITIGDLLAHMATMAVGNEYHGWDTTEPSATDGDAYDFVRDEVTSIVLVHTMP